MVFLLAFLLAVLFTLRVMSYILLTHQTGWREVWGMLYVQVNDLHILLRVQSANTIKDILDS